MSIFEKLFGKKHEHNWKVVAIYNYLDISYDEQGAPSATLTIQCSDCGEVEKKTMYSSGILKLEQFNK